MNCRELQIDKCPHCSYDSEDREHLCYVLFYQDYMSKVLSGEVRYYNDAKSYIMHVYTEQNATCRFYFSKVIELYYPQFIHTIRAVELLS